MLAINVSIPNLNLAVARLVQFPSPQMTDNKSSSWGARGAVHAPPQDSWGP